MGNPFPGMNPYLEQLELWHQVHCSSAIFIKWSLSTTQR
ncbi:DUF4058 family protein [Nostoc sp.]